MKSVGEEEDRMKPATATIMRMGGKVGFSAGGGSSSPKMMHHHAATTTGTNRKMAATGRKMSYTIVGVFLVKALLDCARNDGSFRFMQQNHLAKLHNNSTSEKEAEHGNVVRFPYYHQAIAGAVKSAGGRSAALLKTNETSRTSMSLVCLERMMHDDRLVRSAQHQSKFLARNQEIQYDLLSHFPVETLFSTFTSAWAALPLNKEWGYVHIWKSGGTTMQKQAHADVHDTMKRAEQVSIQSLQSTHKHWFTFVRDPLDHFLSGYSECGFRSSRNIKVSELPVWNESDYNRRIVEYLDKVQQSSGWLPCELHSYPQVNSLLNPVNGRFHAQLQAIGDVTEMPAFLERITGFAYNSNKSAGNDATTNPIKVHYFPARKDLLSNETLQKICRYIALDYYFFDYEPPLACQAHDGILLTPQAQPVGQLQRLQQNQKKQEGIRKADQKVKTKLEIAAKRQKTKEQQLKLQEQRKREQEQQLIRQQQQQKETQRQRQQQQQARSTSTISNDSINNSSTTR